MTEPVSLYRSETRELPLANLPSPLLEKLREHTSKTQLTLEGVRCWLTHSINPPAESFFGKLLGRRANPADPEAEHDTAVVLHPRYVLVASFGAKRGAIALSLPLAQASIARMSALAARLGGTASEPGMDLTGFPGEHGNAGSYFVKLGEDADGAECYRAVEAAIVAEKNGV